jgi:hypothetical protein
MSFLVHKSPPVLTPGCYKAQIADVKAIDGQYGQRLLWTVELVHGEHPYKAMAYTDTSFYTGSREHSWASAVLGAVLLPGQEISENELIGAPVLARISCKPGRNGLAFYTVEDLIVPKASTDSEPGATATDVDEDVPF